MNTKTHLRLLDLQAQQESGDLMYCPRCGRESMDSVLLRNAMSRHADLHICSDCGTAEAMLDMMQNPLPLEQWAAFNNRQAQNDLKALPMSEVIGRVVNKQLSHLTCIYRAWNQKEHGEDFSAYQALATSFCPELFELRRSPFCAVYKAKDGQVLVRFRLVAQECQVAIDSIPKC